MPNPISPATLKGFVPAVTTKVCDSLVKALIGFPAAVYRWYAWAFNADATASNALKQAIVPPGFIMQAAGVLLTQADWLLCNGQSVSKATYPELYAAIGTVYGGDGNPNFLVPNLADKFVIGVGANALAATGGEATHKLTDAEIGPSAFGHTHVVGRFAQSDDNDVYLVVAHDGQEAPDLDSRTVEGVGSTGKGTHYPLSVGGSDYIVTGPAINASTADVTPHENRPPFLALNYFIKT